MPELVDARPEYIPDLYSAAEEAAARLTVALEVLHAHVDQSFSDNPQGFDIAVVEDILRQCRTLLKQSAAQDRERREQER